MPQTVTHQALEVNQLQEHNFFEMKFIVVFIGVLAVASAQFPGFRPQPTKFSPINPPAARPAPPVVNRVANSDKDANIIRYDSESSPDGSFSYFLETDNGIANEAQGTPRDFGGNPPVVPVVIQGTFSWTSPEGQPIAISYVADENGYQPSGDAIPTPPPTPEPILRALRYIAGITKKK